MHYTKCHKIVYILKIAFIFVVVEDRRDDFQALQMSELKLKVQLSSEEILK